MPDSVVGRSLALRLMLAAVPAWLTTAILVFATPWILKLVVGVVVAATLVSPSAGLVAVALVAPLGQLIALSFSPSGAPTFRVTEAIVVAFLAVWLLRPADERPGPRVPGIAGWLLAVVVAASILSQAWQLGQTQPYRGELGDTFDVLFYAYYLVADRIGFIAGMHVLEGIGLAAATVALFRRRPQLAAQLPIALTASAIAAALSSVLLLRGIAPPAVLDRYARIGYRVSAHVADVNAAGSYFAMILGLALGAAGRARGKRRVAWLGAAAAVALGLWLSASRAALAAAAIAIALATVWPLVAGWKPRARLAAIAAIIVIAIAAGALRARRLESDQGYRGVDYRQQFNAASLRMIGASPVFGVGVGQYYRMSALFLSPQLGFVYGFENAHNYFLQVAGELGVVGLVLFLAWLGVPLVRAFTALVRAPRDLRLLGMTAGIVALAGTCLTGHPLLVDEVMFPFWIQFGLMTGLAGSVLRGAAPTEVAAKAARPMPWAWSMAAATAAVVIVAAAPVSARVSAAPPASSAVDGFYGWETANDGVRFRWMDGQFASVFVPANATRAFIPVRMPANIPGVSPLGVEAVALGQDRGRTMVGDTWVDLNIALPDVVPPTRFKRIDLRVDRTWQPGIYLAGSGDMRALGLQVGEVKTLQEY